MIRTHIFSMNTHRHFSLNVSMAMGIALMTGFSSPLIADAGVLDEPLLNTDTGLLQTPQDEPQSEIANTDPDRDPGLDSSNPVIRQEAVQNTVEEEIDELEALPIVQVEERAESGERAAQLVLGTDFAREAQSLSALPAVANQAIEDAVRWYSQAASRGYPGAPSLDYAGVSFYPIRVQRAPN